MKKIVLCLIVLSSILIKVNAQERYLDEIFTDVDVTYGVEYGQNYGVLTGAPVLGPLFMDVYQPAGDTAQKRPVIIYIHTGSFLPLLINGTCSGNMRDSATAEMCRQFARRGYVAVSVDYRVGWNPIGATQDIRTGTLLLAVYRSLQDVKTCVRYMRMNAATGGNTYKIDTGKIVLGGQGSGGYVALAYATLHDPAQIALAKFTATQTDLTYGFIAGQPFVNQALWGGFDGLNGTPGYNQDNWPGYSNEVNMIFNMGGALGDSSWLEPGNVPMICFHVPNDPFAPYGNGPVIVPTTGQFVVDVSGSYEIVRMCNDAAKGNNNAVLQGLPYTDPYTTRANMINDGYEGLFPFILPYNVDSIGQAGPWEWWDLAALQIVAPAYGITDPNQVIAINANSLVTNPDMSKAKALSYIDSTQGYLAPRIVQVLELPGMLVGVNEPEIFDAQVKMFPNPATDHFTLQLDNPKEMMQYLQIYDMTGRLLRDIQNINSSQLNISREGISSGVFVVKIGLGEKEIQGKLIFE